MTDLVILGCTHLSDLYPNVRYKVALMSTPPWKASCIIHDLGEGTLYRSGGRQGWRQTLQLLRIAAGNLWVFLRFLAHGGNSVYVLYPGLPLVLLLGCLPRRWRPRIYVDGFISLYDTVVNDRKLWRADDWRARLLFRFERRGFALAGRVLVDTDDNGAFYAGLFDLPRELFVTVRLSIPPLPAGNRVDGDTAVFRCVFIGSLVPLHGVSTLLEALQRLHSHTRFELLIIGDGQDGALIQRFQTAHPEARLVWQRGMYSTEHLTRAINQSDLCLGVFGASAKAQRVVPYKLYYYTALGAPFLTLSTPAVRDLCGRDATLLTVGEGVDALVDALADCMRNPTRLVRMADASARLYRDHLGKAAIEAQLRRALELEE